MSSPSRFPFIKKVYTAFLTLIGGLIVSFIYDLIKDLPLLSSLVNLSKYVWFGLGWIVTSLIELVNYSVRIWVVIFVVILVYIANVIIRNATKTKMPPKPDYFNYNEQLFRNWRWRWEWIWINSEKKWVPGNFSRFCPTCDTELLDTTAFMPSYNTARCARCNRNYSSYNNEYDYGEEVKAIVEDNIRKGDYPIT